jgi:uncharacterized protein (DUF433 family)
MVTVHPIETIVSDPNIRGGKPIIAGTGIRVIDIVTGYLYREQGPEELAKNYALNLGQVYAVLAYYYQHQDAVDAEIRADEEEAERLLNELEKKGKLTRFE